MTRKKFEPLVRGALESLPERFKRKLQNIDIVLEEGKDGKGLLGLYEGVPLKDRTQSYNMAMPDKITLYMRNIESESKANKTELAEEIRRTLIHEIAHHFGFTDEQLLDEDVY